MLIKLQSVNDLDRIFFNFFRFLLISLGLFSLINISVYGNYYLILPTFLLFLLPLLFLQIKNFCNNIFSIPLIVFLVLYIFIPLTFKSYMGDNYFYGWGFHKVPISQKTMNDNYVNNLYFLLLCLFSFMLSLTLFKTKHYPLKVEYNLRNFPKWTNVVLGLMVFAVVANDISISLEAKKTGVAGSEGLIKFLFFDHAYLFLIGITLFQSNDDESAKKLNQKKYIILLLSFLFIALSLYAGSKGGFLGLFWFFFLLSYIYIRGDVNNYILFPTQRVFFIIGVISPFLFLFMTFYRISITSSATFDYEIVLNVFKNLDFEVLSLLFENIFYRLSAGGLDRCMYIFTAFSSSLMPEYGIQQYLPYVMKNLVNLILPGTPFQEAYSPTSNLYLDVVKSKPLNGDVDAGYLLLYINSQAYTIFGVMTIIGGWTAPILLFLYNFFCCFLYNFFKNTLFRIAIIYLYLVTLACFGFEVGIGYTFHVGVSIYFMYYLLYFLSKIRIN